MPGTRHAARYAWRPSRAETDDAHPAARAGLRAEKGRCTRDVAHDLLVGRPARGASRRRDIVRIAGTVAGEQMGADGVIPMMREAAGHLERPLVPPRHVVNDDDTRMRAGVRWSGNVGLDRVAAMSGDGHQLAGHAAIGHDDLLMVRLSGRAGMSRSTPEWAASSAGRAASFTPRGSGVRVPRRPPTPHRRYHEAIPFSWGTPGFRAEAERALARPLGLVISRPRWASGTHRATPSATWRLLRCEHGAARMLPAAYRHHGGRRAPMNPSGSS